MKRKAFLFLLALPLALQAALAQGKLNFVKETHDFGEVPEGKMATYEFEFVNTGNQPIVIGNVQASCGCTTPFWTKDPVMPGKKGTVKASYNSAGRPGPFTKTITVTSNATEPNKMLTIKGVVVGKDQMPTVTEEQKKNSAHIEYDRTNVNLGRLEVGQSATARFNVKNTGKSDLEIYDAHTTVIYGSTWRLSKPVLKPGESAVLEVTLVPRNKGELNETIQVTSTDYNNYNTKLHVRADVVEPNTTGLMKQGAAPFK